MDAIEAKKWKGIKKIRLKGDPVTWNVVGWACNRDKKNVVIVNRIEQNAIRVRSFVIAQIMPVKAEVTEVIE